MGGALGVGEEDRPADGAGRPWSRRGRLILPLLAVLVVLGAVGVWMRDRDPNRRLGPEPTVEGSECGMGAPPASVLSLDGDTGELNWSRLIGLEGGREKSDWLSPVGLAVAGGTVAVFTESGVTQGLSVGDGSHRWCGQGEIVTAVDDRLFTIRNDRIVEIDPVSGTVEEVAADVLPALLDAAADPIAVRGDERGMDHRARTLTASDRSTGNELWTRDIPGGHQFVSTDELVVVHDSTNGRAEFDFEPGTLHGRNDTITAYELVGGSDAWSVQVPRFGSLFLAGDRLVVKGWDDGKVRTIDSRSGSVIWSVEHDHPGRTGRFSDPGELIAAVEDPDSSDILVLLVSDPPYRD